jgi:hypothetical protein
METQLILTTMTTTFFQSPAYQLLPVTTCFEFGAENELLQFNFIDKQPINPKVTSTLMDLPLNKTLKGSIMIREDKSCKAGTRYLQTIRLYRNAGKKYSTSIFDSQYSHVKVSQSRVTVTMSFPLGDDPARLKARMQNFANIIIDESDEIAAMLNQEGDTKVQEAWQLLAEQVEKGGIA